MNPTLFIINIHNLLPLFVLLVYYSFSAPVPQGPSASPSSSNVSQNSFTFQLNCTSSATFCDKAKLAIQSALQRLSLVITTRVPIQASFQLEDLCTSTKSSSSLSPSPSSSSSSKTCTLLGQAAPAAMFPVQISSTSFLVPYGSSASSNSNNNMNNNIVNVGLNRGAIYLLPQSLIKQSNIDVPSFVSFSKFDIQATFNSNYDWWFASDNQPIKPSQADMELVVLHEMLHGLGFGITSFLPTSLNKQWLLPSYDNVNTIKGNYQFKNPSIWDAFLLSTAPALNSTSKTNTVMTPWLSNYDAYNEVQRGKVTSTTSEMEFLKNVADNTTLAQDAQWRYKTATTPNTIQFLSFRSSTLPSNGNLYIETSMNPFEPGASLAHFSSIVGKDTSDFLMLKSTPSITLTQANGYASTYLKSGLGPGAVQVLQTFGYQINGLSNNVVLSGTVVPFDVGLSSGISLKASIYPTILLAFLSLFIFT